MSGYETINDVAARLASSGLRLSQLKKIPFELASRGMGPGRRVGYSLDDAETYAIARDELGDRLDEGNWVGGCAAPYDEDEVRWHGYWSDAFTAGAFDTAIALAASNTLPIYFCDNHECRVATGLFASTSEKSANLCHLWERTDGPKPGLYLAAKLDISESSPQRNLWNQIKQGTFSGLSVGGGTEVDEKWEFNTEGYLRRVIAEHATREVSATPLPAFRSTNLVIL